MNLKTKLIAGFVLIASIAAVGELMGIYELESSRDVIRKVSERHLPGITSIATIRNSLWQLNTMALTLANPLTESVERSEQYRFDAEFQKIMDASKLLQTTLTTEREKAVWREFTTIWDDWMRKSSVIERNAMEKDRLLADGVAPGDFRIKTLEDMSWAEYLELRRLRKQMLKKFDELAGIKKAEADASMTVARVGADNTRLFVMAMTVLLISSVVIIGLMIKGTLWVFGDLADQSRMANELRAAKEKAEEATRLKDKFVTLVLHDIRAPLTTVVNFLELVNTDNNPPLHSKHKEITGRLAKSMRNLLAMADKLLNITMLQTGKITVECGFFDAKNIVDNAIADMAAQIRDKNIDVKNMIRPGTGRLYADERLYMEVMRNLLSNAVKFTGEGGTITFFTPAGEPATVAVKDTGVGISEPVIRNLFRHEIRTTSVGTKGERGSGLGLPYCHDIIKAHGGSITVESSPGNGSVFYVKLPPRKPVVLVIGEAKTRASLKQGLCSIGAEVVEAEDGNEAVDVVKRAAPNLVVTDSHSDWRGRVNGGLKEKTGAVPILVFSEGEKGDATSLSQSEGGPAYMIFGGTNDLLAHARRFIG